MVTFPAFFGTISHVSSQTVGQITQDQADIMLYLLGSGHWFQSLKDVNLARCPIIWNKTESQIQREVKTGIMTQLFCKMLIVTLFKLSSIALVKKGWLKVVIVIGRGFYFGWQLHCPIRCMCSKKYSRTWSECMPFQSFFFSRWQAPRHLTLPIFKWSLRYLQFFYLQTLANEYL